MRCKPSPSCCERSHRKDILRDTGSCSEVRTSARPPLARLVESYICFFAEYLCVRGGYQQHSRLNWPWLTGCSGRHRRSREGLSLSPGHDPHSDDALCSRWRSCQSLRSLESPQFTQAAVIAMAYSACDSETEAFGVAADRAFRLNTGRSGSRMDGASVASSSSLKINFKRAQAVLLPAPGRDVHAAAC